MGVNVGQGNLHSSNAESFADMAMRLHDEAGVEETIELVLEYALEAVGCDYASVTLVHKRSHIETVAATDPMIEQLHVLQIELGEGPDLDVDDQASVIVRDTELDMRWPNWGKQIAAEGIRSLLRIRLHAGGSTIGTLNLYSKTADQFDTDDQAVAHIMARHAAVAIGTARSEANLWHAADARKVIGQAQGILMERFDLDADRAFAVLVRYSQNKNIKLRIVAETLINTRSLPD
jgi:GAF domain-containing protein